MNKSAAKTNQAKRRGIAFLLLGLFLSMQLVQLSHAHSDNTTIHSYSQNEHYAPTAEKCSICDYLAHGRSEGYYSTDLFELSPLPIHSSEFNEYHPISTNLYAPESFSNKGPPIAV